MSVLQFQRSQITGPHTYDRSWLDTLIYLRESKLSGGVLLHLPNGLSGSKQDRLQSLGTIGPVEHPATIGRFQLIGGRHLVIQFNTYW